MPSQQPRLEIAGIKQRLYGSTSILTRRPITLGQIATWTTERQITHRGYAALRARNDMFHMKGHSRSRFQEPAVFTPAAGTSDHKLPVRVTLRHLLSSRVLRLNPNRNGHGSHRSTRCFLPRKVCQLFRIGDHQLLRFGYQTLQSCCLGWRYRPLAILL